MILRYDIDDKFDYIVCSKQLRSFIKRFDVNISFYLKDSIVKADISGLELYEYKTTIFLYEMVNGYEAGINILSNNRFLDNKKMFLDIVNNSDIYNNTIQFNAKIDIVIERLTLLVKFLHKYNKMLTFI